MLNWHRKYSRSRMTLTAHSPTGHTLTIISTGIPNPVHLHQTAPGDSAKTRLATVPSIPLAMLCAEEHNLTNLRRSARPERPEEIPEQVQCRAREALDRLHEGPREHFILEVPALQSLSAQSNLPWAGIMATLQPYHPPAGFRMGSTVPQGMIWKAAKAVNHDLEAEGLSPALQPPPTLGDPERPERWLEFFHWEYQWDKDQAITARLWQARGESWRQVARRYPHLMQKTQGKEEPDGNDRQQPEPTRTYTLELTAEQAQLICELTGTAPERVGTDDQRM